MAKHPRFIDPVQSVQKFDNASALTLLYAALR